MACFAEPIHDAFGHVAEFAWKSPARKAHMPAVFGLPQRDGFADLAWLGPRVRWNKRVIARMQHQGRNGHLMQQRFGRRPLPIIHHASKAMHRCGEGIVKFEQRARSKRALQIKSTWVLLPFRFGLAFHGAQKHRRVQISVPAFAQGHAAGHQVKRRTHGCHRLHAWAGLFCGFARPTHQGVAAERDAYRIARPLGVRLHPTQDPIDFL